MNCNELYNRTAALCLERSLEDDNNFYSSANRALVMVSLIEPRISKKEIIHFPPKTAYGHCGTMRYAGTPIELSASSVSAFCFLTDAGEGNLRVESNGRFLESIVFSGGNGFAAYKRNVSDYRNGDFADLKLVFGGDYPYCISNPVMYSERICGEPPLFGKYDSYDFSTESGFTGFANPALSCEGRILLEGRDYLISESELLIPRNNIGVFDVLYKRKPMQVTPDLCERELDAAPSLEELLPLLTGYYCHIDSHPQLAAEFLDRYNELALECRKNIETARQYVENVSGW